MVRYSIAYHPNGALATASWQSCLGKSPQPIRRSSILLIHLGAYSAIERHSDCLQYSILCRPNAASEYPRMLSVSKTLQPTHHQPKSLPLHINRRSRLQQGSNFERFLKLYHSSV